MPVEDDRTVGFSPHHERAKAWREAVPVRSAKFNEAIVELSSHTGTELALVACSILEQASIDLLKSVLTNLTHGEDREIFDGPGRPLADFSSRIKVIYGLGLITKEIKTDLETIGRIRNQFAHNFDIASFDDKSINKLCENLKTITQKQGNDSVLKILEGKEFYAEESIFGAGGKAVGVAICDGQENTIIWIDSYLENTSPKNKFVNCVKNLFLILGTQVLNRYINFFPA